MLQVRNHISTGDAEGSANELVKPENSASNLIKRDVEDLKSQVSDQREQQRQKLQKQYQKHWSAQGYRYNSAVHHQQCPQVTIIMVQFSILKSGRP